MYFDKMSTLPYFTIFCMKNVVGPIKQKQKVT